MLTGPIRPRICLNRVSDWASNRCWQHWGLLFPYGSHIPSSLLSGQNSLPLDSSLTRFPTKEPTVLLCHQEAYGPNSQRAQLLRAQSSLATTSPPLFLYYSCSPVRGPEPSSSTVPTPHQLSRMPGPLSAASPPRCHTFTGFKTPLIYFTN